MALFGLSKDRKGDAPSEQVLAYLEEALRRRTPFILVDSKDHETPAQLVDLDEVNGFARFKLQGDLAGDKGTRFTLVFILDGLRIGGECKCVAKRPGQVDLSLPEDLELLERRKHPRARINPKEGATLTALSGLFAGVGLTGTVENLSEGGARVRVERAIEAKGEKKLSLHANLIPRGHSFDLVKVSKLPKIPGVYECPGKAAYLDGGGGGLALGVSFKAFPPEALGALRSLVSGRITAAPSTLPPKTRRIPEPDAPAEPAPRFIPPEPAPARAESKDEPAPPPDPPQPAPERESPGPEAPQEAPALRNPALVRLKKRSRTLLVAASRAGGELDLLAARLQSEGYGKVLAAGTLGELLGALEEPGLGLLFIDGGVAELEGLDLVGTLHNVREGLPPILLALEDLSAEDVLAARQAGVAHLMVKPFALDEDFSRLLENLLGL